MANHPIVWLTRFEVVANCVDVSHAPFRPVRRKISPVHPKVNVAELTRVNPLADGAEKERGLPGMKLRVVIADDEALSRQRLRQFLATDPNAEILAECADGNEAVRAIRSMSPDLVFLDVKMPELDGFGVLGELNGHCCPAVVFVTAYDGFAVGAFDAHAVDYLLKPFDRERFQTAMRRVRERLRAQKTSSLSDLLTSVTARPKPFEHLTVKSDDRIRLLKTVEIDWISSADNYVELHVGAATHLCRITLRTLVRQLPSSQFARISRSVIVNLGRVKEIRRKTHGDFVVVLRAGTQLPGTRNYRENLNGILR